LQTGQLETAVFRITLWVNVSVNWPVRELTDHNQVANNHAVTQHTPSILMQYKVFIFRKQYKGCNNVTVG